MRQKDTSRADKRKEREQRKEEEKMREREQVKRIKSSIKNEILERVNKIEKVAGTKAGSTLLKYTSLILSKRSFQV